MIKLIKGKKIAESIKIYRMQKGHGLEPPIELKPKLIWVQKWSLGSRVLTYGYFILNDIDAVMSLKETEDGKHYFEISKMAANIDVVLPDGTKYEMRGVGAVAGIVTGTV